MHFHRPTGPQGHPFVRRLHRHAGRVLIAASMLGASAVAQAMYPIEITLDVGDLKIAAEATSAGPMVLVGIENKDTRPARCSLTYTNGPETQRRRTDLAPGQQRQISQTLRRTVVVLRIKVACSTG